MIGRLISTLIGLLISVYIICLTIFYFLHQVVRENVTDLCYEVAEVVSTTGRLDKATYQYLTDKAGKYGDYIIKLKLEKQVKPGVYDTFFEKDEIIGKQFQVGDRVSVYMEDKNLTLFGRLVNATFFMYSPGPYTDNRIRTIKTAIIAKNAKNLVKGYDVITDIKTRLSDPDLTIQVMTRLNGTGKSYGPAGTDTSNLIYGDSADEADRTGGNYIFENGDFLKQVEYYSDGSEKCLTYVQQ